MLWRYKKSDAEALGAADELLCRCGLRGRRLCTDFPEQNTLFNDFSNHLVWKCNKGMILVFVSPVYKNVWPLDSFKREIEYLRFICSREGTPKVSFSFNTKKRPRLRWFESKSVTDVELVSDEVWMSAFWKSGKVLLYDMFTWEPEA